MPTRDVVSLSKRMPHALDAHPPQLRWPAPLRWSASVALALGTPLLLATAARWLGPGPHATVRVELSLERIGGGGAGGTGAGTPSIASPHRPAGGLAPAAAVTPSSPIRAVSAPQENALPPLRPSDAPAPPSGPQSVVQARHPPPIGEASAPLNEANREIAAPGPIAVVPSPLPPGTAHSADAVPAGSPSINPSAQAGKAPTATEAAPATQAAGAPGTGIGPGGAERTVGPESLDAGFALAGPLRLTYPPQALARSQGGSARIEVEIEATGSVARVTVLDETGRWGFGAAAQRAYAAARFTPPRIAGRPVRVVLRKTIEFEP